MATVLIIEDDKLSQKILAKTLSNAGHEALTTATIDQAWIQLRHAVIVDLIILDNQLKNEWGWEFLRALRKDLIYQTVPVIVYTAHTERSTLLKYVELGVQGMLVKPYNAQAVLAEIAKAVRTGWASRLMESPQTACERLKINQTDYSYILNTAASSLGRSVMEARRLQTAPGAKLQPVIENIKAESIQLGSPLFKTLISSIEEAIVNRDHATIDRCLSTMEAVVGLVRQRAMNCVGMGDSISNSHVATRKTEDGPAPLFFEPPSSAEAVFHRKMAAQPIWNFGRHFGRLRGARLFAEGDLAKLAEAALTYEPLATFFSATKLLAQVDHMPVDDTVHAITDVRGFDAVYLRISAQLGFAGQDSSTEENVRNAIRYQGTAKAITIAAAGRIATAGKAPSPLDLRPLLEHTVAVSLLSFEIGRLLDLDDPHNLSAAGPVHDIGKWYIATAEPALYAAVLALTQAEQISITKSEIEIFGLAHAEAGELLLRAGGASPLLRATTLHLHNPQNVKEPRLAPFVAAVHLAGHIARAIQSADEKFIAETKLRLSAPAHPVWAIFKAGGIDLLFDIPELVETIFSIAKTTAWTTGVLLKGP